MSNWFDLKFTVGPYMIYFCCFWCKIILTVDFHVTGKEGLSRWSFLFSFSWLDNTDEVSECTVCWKFGFTLQIYNIKITFSTVVFFSNFPWSSNVIITLFQCNFVVKLMLLQLSPVSSQVSYIWSRDFCWFLNLQKLDTTSIFPW